jgi:hypothetical protein
MRQVAVLLLCLSAASCDANSPLASLFPFLARPRTDAPAAADASRKSDVADRPSADGTTLRIFARKYEPNRTTTTCGTGFAIRHNGETYVLTAAHIVNQDGYTIEFEDEAAQFSEVWLCGKDAAILKMRTTPANARILDVCTSPLANGDSLQALGYAHAGALLKTKGIFLKRGIMTCPIETGMSGGPVLRDGKAIGLVSCFYPELGIASYAPIDEVLRELDARRRGDSPAAPKPPLAGTSAPKRAFASERTVQ